VARFGRTLKPNRGLGMIWRQLVALGVQMPHDRSRSMEATPAESNKPP